MAKSEEDFPSLESIRQERLDAASAFFKITGVDGGARGVNTYVEGVTLCDIVGEKHTLKEGTILKFEAQDVDMIYANATKVKGRNRPSYGYDGGIDKTEEGIFYGGYLYPNTRYAANILRVGRNGGGYCVSNSTYVAKTGTHKGHRAYLYRGGDTFEELALNLAETYVDWF